VERVDIGRSVSGYLSEGLLCARHGMGGFVPFLFVFFGEEHTLPAVSGRVELGAWGMEWSGAERVSYGYRY
jgi:hypothetical protein